MDIRIRGIKSKCGNILAFILLLLLLLKKSGVCMCTEPPRRRRARQRNAPHSALTLLRTAISISACFTLFLLFYIYYSARSFHRYHRSTGLTPLTGCPPLTRCLQPVPTRTEDRDTFTSSYPFSSIKHSPGSCDCAYSISSIIFLVQHQ